MNKNKELAKNTLIITIGKISTQFISFLLLPLYTALLSKEEYGVVDLVNSYVQLILPIVILQMDQALLRYMIMSRNTEIDIKRCLSTTYILFGIQMIVATIIFLVVSPFANNKYLVYLYINVLSVVFSSYALQTARGFGDTMTYSISSFLGGALTVGCNVLFIAGWHMKAEGLLLAPVVGNLISSIYVLIRVKLWKYVRINRFDRNYLKQMFRYAWPLIPNAIIWWIVNASDRSIVLMFLGISDNGLLAVSHKFPTILTTIYNIFHISWTESAAIHLAEKDKDVFFSKVYDTIIRIFIAATLLLIGIMPFVFDILVNQNFKDAYYQIPIYSLASLFNVIVGLYSVIYISNMKTREIAKTSLYSGIINIFVHVLLIRHIGLYAAPISSAVAFGIMAIYRTFDSKKYIKRSINVKLLISSIFMLTLGLFAYYQENILFKCLSLVIAFTYSLVINFRNIKSIRTIVISRMKKESK